MTSHHDADQPTGHRTQHQPSPATNGLGCDHTETQPQAPIRAALDEISSRYRAADRAGDWQTREVLGPLVDVADYLNRMTLPAADHHHYRAEKAGYLVRAAHRAHLEALTAVAGWPDDPHDSDLRDAAALLDIITIQVHRAMWRIANADVADAATTQALRDVARSFTRWATRGTTEEHSMRRWSALGDEPGAGTLPGPG